MICQQCGRENEEDSLFCADCGKRLSASEEETPTPVQATPQAGEGLAETALKLGKFSIIGVLFSCFGVVMIGDILLALAGVGCAVGSLIQSMATGVENPKARAALVLSLVSLLLNTIIFLAALAILLYSFLVVK